MKSILDGLLSAAVDGGDLLGVAATVGTAAEILYEGAAGRRTLDDTEGMSPETILWMASMTKPVAGTAVMQQVEQGALTLDDPAREVLPELGEIQVLEGFAPSGDLMLRRPRAEITLRQLMTHSAGFGYDVWDETMRRYRREQPDGPEVLRFDPGERWMYGTSIDWAAKMVEAATGLRLGTYLKGNVFEPLAMASTAFGVADDDRSRLADLHTKEPDGSFALTPFHSPEAPKADAGGGGLYMTVTDYLRFGRALLNGGVLDGARILRPETVASMATDHLGPIEVTTLQPAIRRLSEPVDFFPGIEQKWGLTFLINTETSAEGRSAGSLCWAGLANSYFWIDLNAGVCGVWATQLLPFVDAATLRNFRAFERAVYEQR